MPPPPKPWENNGGGSTTAGAAAASSALTTTSGGNALGTSRPLPRQPIGGAYGSSSLGMGGYSGSMIGGGYGGSSMLGGYGGSSMLGGYGGSSMLGGYGGMGLGGMGGMYGGMGGMYGGMGGMGMGGMGIGMGMGMGGMGMMGGPTEVEQRGQMAFMMLGRVVELFGAFGHIVQMVFGSIAQFMGSYIGLSQQYQQLNDGDEVAMQYNEDGTFVSSRGSPTGKQLARRRRKGTNQAQQESPVRTLLRRLALLLVAYLIVTRLVPKLRSWAGF